MSYSVCTDMAEYIVYRQEERECSLSRLHMFISSKRILSKIPRKSLDEYICSAL